MTRRRVLTRASDIPPKRDYQREHRERACGMGLEMDDKPGTSESCPRRLVGKHHRDYDASKPCWCLSGLNDHGRRYRRASDNAAVVMWEPYGAWSEDLLEVFAAAAADGLRVHVSAMSPWNPGATVCIAFTRESGAPDAA